MRKTLTNAGLLALLALSPSLSQAQEVYGKIGILGIGAGYAYGLNEKFTLRGDLTTMGSYKRNGTSGDFDYRGKLTNDVATAYADYFPFENGFRLTLGLGLRNTKVDAQARTGDNQTISIGDAKDIPLDGNDHVSAKLKFPTAAPYLGLGWGHNVGAQRQKGWGFIADAGVYIGKPKVSLNVSDSVRAKLTAANFNADDEIARQKADFEEDAKKLRLFPAIYVGISYTF